MTAAGPVLALDIGGTKLAAAVVTMAGEVVDRREIATQPTGAADGEALWANVSGLLDDVVDAGRLGGRAPAAVGVGCGGPMSWPAGEVSPLNIAAWRDFPLRARLRERFPTIPVRVHNDAIAMAAGEHWRGAGRGARGFLGVVVSTGVGGGLVVDGQVVAGETGNAGHLGHVVVDANGPDCECGGRGCLEAIARGPAVVRWALDNGWQPADIIRPDGRALLESARDGDATATAAFVRAGTALGVALASAAHLLELDVVAIGGGLAQAGEMLLEPARAAFARHARMPFAARCRIVPAELGVDAGLVGAAAIVAAGDAYWTGGAD